MGGPSRAIGPDEISEREAARFWAKVDRTGPCWLWRGAATSDGSPTSCCVAGRAVAARRVGFVLRTGRSLPAHIHLTAVCGRPLCVRHVGPRVTARLRTQLRRLDLDDAAAAAHFGLDVAAVTQARAAAPPRERARRLGENTSGSRLTARQVTELRQLAAAGTPSRVLALRYGVGKTTVLDAMRGRTWPHLPGAMPRDSARLPDETVRRLRRHVQGGLTILDAAKAEGVPSRKARAAVHGDGAYHTITDPPAVPMYQPRAPRLADRAHQALELVAAGVSIAEAAAATGVHPGTVYRWCADTSSIPA